MKHRVVQRRHPLIILGVDIGAVGQKQLGHLLVVKTSRNVQRSLVGSIPDIDVGAVDQKQFHPVLPYF